MGNLIIFLVRFYKDFLGQTLFSAYYCVHLTRGCFLSYKTLGIDIVTIIVFAILGLAYLIQTYWRLKHHYEDKKSKRLYLFITWTIHIVFNAWFIIHYLHYDNAWLLVSEVLVYWAVEAAIHLWIINEKK